MSFRKAMIEVRKTEGGYVNDPDDIGRETYIGISRKFFPKWNGWKIIDRVKKNAGRKLRPNEKISDYKLNKEIDEFYYHYFWKPLKCDQIKNEILSEHLFDSGINLGKKSAVRFFQETVNKHAGNSLVVDGLIGPATIGKLNSLKNDFTNFLVEKRIELYFTKCYEKPIKFKYLRGWCMRSLKYLDK